MICWGIRLQSSYIQFICYSIVDQVKKLYSLLTMINKYLKSTQPLFNQYYYSDMKVRLDQTNFVVFNPQVGGRIIQLQLSGKNIIQGRHSELDNGSYLMYPWVNRIKHVPFNVPHPYKDGNSIPLHGLYVDSPRTASVFAISNESIGIEMTPQIAFEGVPSFTQTFILSRGKFQQKIKVDNSSQHDLPVCFGYHPYLQIDDEEIKSLKLMTDIKTNIKLDEKLMTNYPYQKKDMEVRASEKYDSLFEGGSFLEISSQAGFHVKISSSLPYWQIYTPPDGKRIAVQPMSFTGNLYDISSKGHSPKLSEGSLQISAWQQN